jgi:hypothetical protein
MLYFIYALGDPRTSTVAYAGITNNGTPPLLVIQRS